MTYGVTTEGFVKKRFEDVVDELEASFKTEFGAVNTSEEAVIGQLIRIYAKSLSDIWELMESVYNSQYPASADGVSLDNVSDIVGITRLAATQSVVVLTCFGTEGTTLLSGRLVEVPESGNQFQILVDTDITTAAANYIDLSVATVADSTDYIIEACGIMYTYNSGIGATAASIMTGLAGVYGCATTTFTDNLDGTANIIAIDDTVPFSISVTANLQIDLQASPVVAQAVEYGPIVGVANTITSIVTPVSGWDLVTNNQDATLGRNQETDTQLRIRRAQSLQVAGYATVESIRARLLQVTDVTGVSVIENRDIIPDGAGRPGKSYECVVQGGDNTDIANVIWESKPAGIETYGSTTVVVVDSEGHNQNVYFSRPTPIYMWLKITITAYTEEEFPATGATLIQDYALAYAETEFSVGVDVIVQRFIGEVFKVDGIATVLVEIATSATPAGPPGAYTTTNLTISETEVALFDSTRFTLVGP